MFNLTTYGIDFSGNELSRLAGLHKTSNFPPYNIIKENDDKALIELAVSGFSIDDIEIEQEKDVIKISGKKEKRERDYIHKGIAERSFSISFKIAENVNVGSATIQNGILTIELNIEKPEKKTIKIDLK